MRPTRWRFELVNGFLDDRSTINSQARRVGKSNAGGVSHRYANIRDPRPEGPTLERMCRPFRPESQYYCSPVAHRLVDLVV